MRLHGYCERCHRIKLVRVSGHGMAMYGARGIVTGICDACQEKEDEERRKRHERRQ